jgi:hypothetical protein
LRLFTKRSTQKKELVWYDPVKKKIKSMILRPVKHGKKCAIVLSDQVLEAAGLSKTGQIQLIINPCGGLLLQAAEVTDEETSLAAFKKVKRKYSRLFRRLADR